MLRLSIIKCWGEYEMSVTSQVKRNLNKRAVLLSAGITTVRTMQTVGIVEYHWFVELFVQEPVSRKSW